ncbi:hypothetical protein COY25_01385 [Candidatus Uhrbacteria bacterium CG_4_10_14_0_2_um_filter_41_7]|uniref:Uncharacterized protein n=1 Tax=Candidatus Uhrbacteria bacterium CG_4_9_14_3_um_filter_41_35 TaxID=1975034 RepID=A0A2M7XEH8_9BACT|nr:MAG: hypothetical protein COV92_02995 [Candidatus Uhrbacteria bacterium CG11_big_fil_rev_8_21_14_0_20_41_9]PIZ54991.1 MAG: hypothetical protein COY25_01385 [Candidatus Uhrbacteria bacterium CG_4_10_14_0_2_um_filter_41_7]PJA46293.1 MAG: hypothetical protein CO173_03205 [Candidatus Uhrbacteria bacterium CG_4_9_14_3_um_filter_41_35]
MADLKDTQFYELKRVEEPNGFSTKFNSKKVKQVLLITGASLTAIIFLVFAITTGLSFTKTKKLTGQNENQKSNTEVSQTLTACEAGADVEFCKNRVTTENAITSGQVRACEGLPSDAYKSCVNLVAFDQKNLDYCKLVDGEGNTECSDHVRLLLATANNDYSACAGIANEDERLSCQNQIAPFFISEGRCSEVGLNETLCEKETLTSIKANGSPYDCGGLPDVDYQSCSDYFATLDSDSDGLNDWREASEFGTDRFVADTDADGYNDGVEVAGGFDPLN